MDLMRRRLLMAGNGLKDYTIFGKSEVVGSSVLGVGDVKNWCQLCSVRNLSNTWSDGFYVSCNPLDGSVRMSGSATTSKAFAVSETLTITSGHKYLLATDSNINLALRVGDYLYGRGNHISTASVTLTQRLVIDTPVGTYDAVVHPMLFDLTAIFGSGNEPTSVEGFKSWLVSVGKMKSADGDIPYFPYDAGSTFASLPIVALKGYNSIDLGNLASSVFSYRGNNIFSIATSALEVKPSTMNFILDGYTPIRASYSINDSDYPDMSVKSNASYANTIYIRDSRYTDVASFRAGLSGKVLYYERESATEVSSTTFPLAISAPLHGVGTADYAKFTDKGITRKDFVIDMGSLNYNLVNNVAGRFVCSDLRGMFAGSATSVAFPALSAVYHAVPYSNAWTDNLCMFSNAGTTGNYIYFRNDAYSDVASFKAAMSGVQLVLQLAEETFESVKLPKLPKFKDGTLVYTDTEIHGNITTE